MIVTTHNISAADHKTIIDIANSDAFRKLIPTIIFYSLLSVFGTAGNILSIYIFIARMRSSLQTDLFTLLSVVNLLACGISIPMEIMNMTIMYKYPSVIVCKANRFLNLFTMLVSTVTLSVMAVFRLKSVRSGTVANHTKNVRAGGILAILLGSASISWIAPIVFGMRSIPTFVDDVMGQDCSVADDTEHTAWPMVFNILLCVGFAVLIIIIIVSYYRIWRIVKTSRLAVTSHGGLFSVSCHEKFKESPAIGHVKTGTRETANQNGSKMQPDKSERLIEVLQNVDLEDKSEDVAKTEAVLDGTNLDKLVFNKEKENVQQLSVFVIETDSDKDTPSMTRGDCGSSSSLFCQKAFIRRPVSLMKYMVQSKSSRVDSIPGTISVISNCGSSNTTDFLTKPVLESFSERSAFKSKEVPESVIAGDNLAFPDKLGQKYAIRDIHDLSMFSASQSEGYDSQKYAIKDIHDLSMFSASQSEGYDNDHGDRFVSTDSSENLPRELCPRTSCSQEMKLSDKPDEDAAKLGSTRKAPKASLEAAITRTTFLLALTFVISYVPFFLVSIPRMFEENIDYSTEGVKLNLINVSVRLYFVMPSISPVIFWASNLDFRRKCRAVWTRDNSLVI